MYLLDKQQGPSCVVVAAICQMVRVNTSLRLIISWLLPQVCVNTYHNRKRKTHFQFDIRVWRGICDNAVGNITTNKIRLSKIDLIYINAYMCDIILTYIYIYGIWILMICYLLTLWKYVCLVSSLFSYKDISAFIHAPVSISSIKNNLLRWMECWKQIGSNNILSGVYLSSYILDHMIRQYDRWIESVYCIYNGITYISYCISLCAISE